MLHPLRRIALTPLMLTLLMVSGAGGQPHQPVPFPYVDEAQKDGTLVQFRAEVLDIVKRGALPELLAVTASDSAEARAKTDFIERELTDVAAVRWRDLGRALTLGGAFTTTRGAVRGRLEFCAPYVYAAFPPTLPESIGAEQTPHAIVGDDVRVFERADSRSRVVAKLSRVIVDFLDYAYGEGGSEPQYVRIALAPSRSGWVEANYLRSPDDWHVCFARVGGLWRVSEFDKREVEYGTGSRFKP